jgi:hypothetical protein
VNKKQADNEREIRKGLGRRLGVEFCTDDELQTEFDKAQGEIEAQATGVAKRSPTVPPEGEGVTVGDIIRKCNDVNQTLSRRHPHAHLLYMCASALDQLVKRLARYEDPATGQPLQTPGKVN